MILSPELANDIVERAMVIIHHNVNVINNNGIIIASGDKSRIGTTHEIGRRVALTGKAISIYDDEVDIGDYVAPGINSPIIVDNEVLFVVGVSGNPNEISKYAALANLTAELLAKQELQHQELNWSLRINDLAYNDIININFRYEFDISIKNILNTIQQTIQKEKQPYLIRINSELYNLHLMRKVIDSLNLKFDFSNLIVLSTNTLAIFTDDELTLIDTLKEQRLSTETSQVQYLDFKVVKSYPSSNIYSLLDSICYGLLVLDEINNRNHWIINGLDAEIILNLLVSDLFCLSGSKAIFQEKNSFYAGGGEVCGIRKHSIRNSVFSYLYSSILKHPSGIELINTLKAYFEENLEILKTAQKLNVHRNTLKNRFKLIQELTKLDPYNFKHLSVLYFILLNNKIIN